MSVVLTPAPAAVQHLRAAAGSSADASVLSRLSSAALAVKQAAAQQLQKPWLVP